MILVNCKLLEACPFHAKPKMGECSRCKSREPVTDTSGLFHHRTVTPLPLATDAKPVRAPAAQVDAVVQAAAAPRTRRVATGCGKCGKGQRPPLR